MVAGEAPVVTYVASKVVPLLDLIVLVKLSIVSLLPFTVCSAFSAAVTTPQPERQSPTTTRTPAAAAARWRRAAFVMGLLVESIVLPPGPMPCARQGGDPTGRGYGITSRIGQTVIGCSAALQR